MRNKTNKMFGQQQGERDREVEREGETEGNILKRNTWKINKNQENKI